MNKIFSDKIGEILSKSIAYLFLILATQLPDTNTIIAVVSLISMGVLAVALIARIIYIVTTRRHSIPERESKKRGIWYKITRGDINLHIKIIAYLILLSAIAGTQIRCGYIVIAVGVIFILAIITLSITPNNRENS